MKFYWPSELYSFGKYYRKYARYPRFLPLLFYSDHSGPSFDAPIEEHEIENDANLFFTFSEKKKKEIEELTNKKAYVVISPQIFYRRKNNIKKLDYVEGTIAFPDHVMPETNYSYSIHEYCKDLLKLPKKFHPISICLHMHDMNKESHKTYEEYGFKVVSAGNTSHRNFIKKVYEILKNYKYITSNMVGTSGLIALEMGHNFFIYPNINSKVEDSFKLPDYIKNHILYKYLKSKTVDNVDEEIEKDIYKEIEKAFGVTDGISRSKFTWLVWRQFLIELVTLKFFYKLINKIKNTYKIYYK